MTTESLFKILTDTYVELNKLYAEPGAKCHMLADSIMRIERMLKKIADNHEGLYK